MGIYAPALDVILIKHEQCIYHDGNKDAYNENTEFHGPSIEVNIYIIHIF